MSGLVFLSDRLGLSDSMRRTPLEITTLAKKVWSTKPLTANSAVSMCFVPISGEDGYRTQVAELYASSATGASLVGGG